MEFNLDPGFVLLVGIALLMGTGIVAAVRDATQGSLSVKENAVYIILVILGVLVVLLSSCAMHKSKKEQRNAQIESLNEWTQLSEELEGCNFSQCEEVVVREFLKNNPDLTLSLDNLEFFHDNHGDVVAGLLVPFTVTGKQASTTFDPEAYHKEFLESKTPEERREYALELLGEMRKDAYGD